MLCAVFTEQRGREVLKSSSDTSGLGPLPLGLSWVDEASSRRGSYASPGLFPYTTRTLGCKNTIFILGNGRS